MAICLAAPARADSVAVFSEVHYHPADGGSEWVELHNQLAVDLDLSGWSLAGGIGYAFPPGTVLTTGGYLVVAATPAGVTGALGPWTGRLDNAGDSIELVNNNGRVMDRLEYGTEGSWPVAADGSGVTLAKRAPNLATDDPASWQPSHQPGGTPGAVNFPSVLPTVITPRVGGPATWRMWASGTNPGIEWTTAGFDDSAWAAGSGAFRLGSDPLPAPAVALTSLPSGPTTYYFRTHFAFPGVPATTRLRLRLLADDGAAVHLNGVELVRTNLAADAAAATTAIIPHRAPPRVQEFDVPPGALLTGDNVLAAEVHQAASLPAYPAAVITAGPVAYWRMGETSSPVNDLAELSAAPESGPQNGSYAGLAVADLTSAGPRPADLVGGSPLNGFEESNLTPDFQGAAGGGNDVALFPDDGNLDFSGSGRFSFELWVKGNPTQSSGGAILAKGTGGGGEQFALDVSGGRYRFFAWDGGSPNTPMVAQSDISPNNTWQHIACVCDLSIGKFRIYVNGVQRASDTSLSQTLASNTHEISVGARKLNAGSGYNLTFDGAVDEVAIFNRALGTAEIAAHYNAAFATSATGPDTADAVFWLELDTLESPDMPPSPPLVLNELGGAGADFGVELTHTSSSPLAFPGGTLSRFDSLGIRHDFTIPPQTIPAGGLLVFNAATLGWTTVAGDRIVLATADGIPLDGKVVEATPRAREPDGTGEWMRTDTLSLGTANEVPLHHEVVINEIMYHPHELAAGTGQWIELRNISVQAVDLTGWSMDGGVTYAFPPGTVLEAGAYQVVAANPAAMPGIGALGPWSGSLKRGGDGIELLDSNGNPADRVRYHSGGPWPETADGGGASLELRDPRADRLSAANWAASDESGKSAWQTFTWRGPATPGVTGEPTLWNEIDLGLVDGPGEFLLDDVRVTDTTTGQSLVQNGDFSSGISHWRAVGTHRLSRVAPEPGNPGNPVLRVIATGPAEYQGNQLESTFLNNTALVAGREYEISLRARWLAGGGKLNTRLYFNRLARTHDLTVPASGGTPGRSNSLFVSNIGPVFSGLAHSPVVPAPGAPVTVSVTATDPDGLAALTLRYAVAGGGWQSVPMTTDDGHHYAAGIPGQAAGSIVQFYIEGADPLGAASACPARGVDSRALYVVEDGQAAGGSPHKFRLVMTAADAAFMHTEVNVLSNAYLGATVIADENDVYYDVGARLKGSFVGRNVPRVGFNIRFHPDRLFRGVHDKVAIDRSAHAVIGASELIAKHIASSAGGIPNMYDDLARFIHVLPTYTSGCILRLTGYEDGFLASQYPNGDDGTMFEYEGFRSTSATSDGTPDGIKLPGGGGYYVNLDLKDLGDDKEAYRWVWLHSNHRTADNFSAAIATGKLFSLTGLVLDAEAKARLDVDQWLRAMAYQSLLGVGDAIYTDSNVHNIRFYSRPQDGRMLYMPWDWDGCFAKSATGPLVGSGNVAKLVNVSAHNQRTYYHHLHDLVSHVYNTSHMSRWTQHYGAVNGEDFSSILSYIGTRANHVTGQLPASPAFAATAGTVGANGLVTLTGSGGLAIGEIEVNGQLYSPVWISNATWQVTVPVPGGTSMIVIAGIDRYGQPVAGATSSLVVTNPNPPGWAAIRVNEWMAANTTIADPADGKKDDWFELFNPTDAAVDLGNWLLSDNPSTPGKYTIPSGTIIPAGGFLLVWADENPLQSVPGGSLHANFKLSATGESILVSAPDGTLIDSVTFGPQPDNATEGGYPDGSDEVLALTAPTPGGSNVLMRALGLTHDGGAVEFTFSSTAGHHYRVETSSDLVTWTTAAPDLTAVGPVTWWSEPATAFRRFYRAVLLPL